MMVKSGFGGVLMRVFVIWVGLGWGVILVSRVGRVVDGWVVDG